MDDSQVLLLAMQAGFCISVQVPAVQELIVQGSPSSQLTLGQLHPVGLLMHPTL
jgi:hypothetical protein